MRQRTGIDRIKSIDGLKILCANIWKKIRRKMNVGFGSIYSSYFIT